MAVNDKERDRIKRRRSADPAYDEQFKAQRRAYAKAGRERLKRLVIEAYGGKCVCCGKDYFPHLTLDHADGSGGDERRANRSSMAVYRRLRDLLPERDPNIQVMCYCCNIAKHWYGRCGCTEPCTG